MIPRFWKDLTQTQIITLGAIGGFSAMVLWGMLASSRPIDQNEKDEAAIAAGILAAKSFSGPILTKDNWSSTVDQSDKPVLVDFWAPWCGPCRGFAPVFEQASEKHPDIVFAKLNTDAVPEIAQQFSIRSIPTLMVFREKVILYANPGAMPATQFDQLIGQVKEVDMAKVHAEIAASKTEQA